MKKSFLALLMVIVLIFSTLSAFASTDIGPWIADLSELPAKSAEYSNKYGKACEAGGCYIYFEKSTATVTYNNDGSISPNGRTLDLSFGEDESDKYTDDFTFGFKISSSDNNKTTNVLLQYLAVDSSGQYQTRSMIPSTVVTNYLLRFEGDRILSTKDFRCNNSNHSNSSYRISTDNDASSWHDVRFEVDYPDNPESDSAAFYISTHIDNTLVSNKAPVPKTATIDGVDYTIKGIYYVQLCSQSVEKYKDIYMYPGISNKNISSDLSKGYAQVVDIKVSQGNEFLAESSPYTKASDINVSAIIGNNSTSIDTSVSLIVAEYNNSNELVQIKPVSKNITKSPSMYRPFNDIVDISLSPSDTSHHIKLFVMDSIEGIIPLSKVNCFYVAN